MMIDREYIYAQLATLPENALEKVMEFIAFQQYTLGLYDNDTDYLMSVPGMADKIKEGFDTALEECAPLSEVWADV